MCISIAQACEISPRRFFLVVEVVEVAEVAEVVVEVVVARQGTIRTHTTKAGGNPPSTPRGGPLPWGVGTLGHIYI